MKLPAQHRLVLVQVNLTTHIVKVGFESTFFCTETLGKPSQSIEIQVP